MTWTLPGSALALLIWAGFFQQLHRVHWRLTGKGERAFCLVLLAAGIVFTFTIPPVAATVDRALALPHFERYLIACVALFGSWTLYPFVEHYWGVSRDEARWLHSPWLMIGAIGALTILYGVSVQAGLDQTDTSLHVVYEAHLIALGYLGLTAARMFLFGWRSARLLADPASRQRAHLYTVGWGLAVATNINATLSATHNRFATLIYTTPDPLTVTTVLLVTGVGLLSCGPLLDARDWWQRRGEHRELAGFWELVYRTAPDIALIPPTPGVRGKSLGDDLDFAFFRRVIEILDGLMTLRAYADPAIVDYARVLCRRDGLGEFQARATVEAAGFAVALRARERGAKPQVIIQGAREGGARDLAEEVAFLRAVYRAYRRSPIVAAALRAADARTNGGEEVGQHGL